ncbi:hypothetical protein RF11_10311 [Thelohanellus kitauei]|uniref:Uncharacterized protein n=1 Tax=Thelohanellus kitauei TaxID=669202 RepID=A0A0C2MVX7_THEKT|nr:hypothetical protein RF11_10311 [Thelohanellus kitauei]
MTDDFNKIIISLVKSQQEQTEVLIRAQREQMSTVIETVTVVSSFEAFQASKEAFSVDKGRLKPHFTSCGVTDSCDKKAKLLSWMESETYSIISEIRLRFDTELSYEEICTSLTQYCEPEIHYVHARVEFSRCVLKPDQTYRQ